MPGLVRADEAPRKRKRTVDTSTKSQEKPRKAPKKSTNDKQGDAGDLQAQVLSLENGLSNNASKVQTIVDNVHESPEDAIFAAVSLCRAFCRAIAGDDLVRRKDSSEEEVERVQALRQQLRTYVQSLSLWIGGENAKVESAAVTLLMRLVKAETSTGRKSGEQVWTTEGSSFSTLLSSLLQKSEAEGARQEFVEKYLEEHDDVRYYSLLAVKRMVQGAQGGTKQTFAKNALDILSQIEDIPESVDELEDWFGSGPNTEKHSLLSLSAHRKAAREAWLAVFQSPLNAAARKTIVSVMNAQILPWFVDHIELLTDFLTDSFNHGGSTALLALNGIFHLMTDKNIDYPDFYTKLYSLLDQDILHSKHRSRFFRLLETFMASTHLPAALVASFMKRLARLALQAPPGAIVWIVPWTYNMMQQHPSCTFMLHRTYHPAHVIYASNPKYEDEGMDDPFDMSQPDPLLSGAIDSSLWELETLRSHYHPNVATLAKILGEQFTKRDYQLEDFLDHSYASLIDADLGKEIKKTPVVEWDIPKRIVTEDGEDASAALNRIGSLLQSAMEVL